jgi:flagellar basal-body rod protein FlgB
MGPNPISDTTMQSLQSAMRGLSARRQSFQDNIANAETPGYLASRVSFEDSLASAMAQGEPTSMATSMSRTTDPTNMNGNNVQVDQELVGLSENQLRGQLVTEALNAKYRLLRAALGTA